MVVPRYARLRLRGAEVLILSILILNAAIAQEPFHSASQSGAETEVLDRQQIQLDTRTITYDRIEAPVLQPRPAPSVIPPAPMVPPTAAEQALIDQWLAKRHDFMFLSVTVYDNGVSVARWWRPEGEYLFWSDIDFNHVRCSDFETSQATYSLMLGVGNDSIQSLETWNATQSVHQRQAIPQLPPLNGPRMGSRYKIISSPQATVDHEALQGLEDLHRYYDAHKTELIQQYQQSEAARLAQEEYLRAHPPQPKNTVIQYFPIRSSSKRGETK